jgi:hypothetical protein
MTTKNFFSRDGTLVYNVGFYIIEEVRYHWWHISLTDEQADTIRAALEKLAADGKVGHWQCEVMTVKVDDLAEAADLIRSLERRPRATEPTRPGHPDPTPEPARRPGRVT